MSPELRDLRRLLASLDGPDTSVCSPDHLARLRRDLPEAVVVGAPGQTLITQGGQRLGLIHPYGSLTLYLPTDSMPLRYRLLDLDRGGRVTVAIRRGGGGEFLEARVRNVDGTMLGVLPRGAQHPLWGASDRIVQLGESGQTNLLTVCRTVNWDAIAAIPPLADPTRLPPGAGTGILNMLASLASDQKTGPLRYRGPFPTEQLFWALTESFRFESGARELFSAFTGAAEDAFAAGHAREAPVDWTAAPHERLFLPEGIYVQLRHGVEKVYWDGRTYYRPESQGLLRREHRVIRTVTAPDGGLRFVASLEALGRPLEDHLVLDATGALLERHPAPSDAGLSGDTPLAEPWRETLGALLPLESTPLLATAIATVWPTLTVVWGSVPQDLIETRGTTVRLSTRLVGAYLTDGAGLPAVERRPLARRFVHEVLGLIGPPLRQAAAAWLEAETPARQEAHLEAAACLDREAAAAHATEPLGRLLAALEAGEALPG